MVFKGYDLTVDYDETLDEPKYDFSEDKIMWIRSQLTDFPRLALGDETDVINCCTLF